MRIEYKNYKHYYIDFKFKIHQIDFLILFIRYYLYILIKMEDKKGSP